MHKLFILVFRLKKWIGLESIICDDALHFYIWITLSSSDHLFISNTNVALNSLKRQWLFTEQYDFFFFFLKAGLYVGSICHGIWSVLKNIVWSPPVVK